MLRFVAQRLLYAILVVLGSTALVFALSTVVVADPARAALGLDASAAQVDQYRHEMGLDRPIWIQYARYMARVATGDLGRSIVSGGRITDELGRTIPASIELILPSIIIAALVGVALGAGSASSRGQLSDHLTRLVSIAGMSLPVFWLGIMLQVAFYGQLSWLPSSGRLSITAAAPPFVTGLYTLDSLLARDWGGFVDAVRHLILPVVSLSLVNVATMARMTRASLLDALGQDYIRTARAKGMHERVVLYRHALRNALIPVVTIFGLRIGTMLGGAVLVETIFAWPGIGRYAVFAMQHVDLPVVAGFTIYVTVACTLVNLLVDISYALIDPRVSVE